MKFVFNETDKISVNLSFVYIPWKLMRQPLSKKVVIVLKG